MISLVKNEIMKFIFKRKMILIILLLLIFVSLFSYGQKYSYDRNIERFKTLSGGQEYDWKSLTVQRLNDLQKRSNNEFIPEDAKNSLDSKSGSAAMFFATMGFHKIWHLMAFYDDATGCFDTFLGAVFGTAIHGDAGFTFNFCHHFIIAGDHMGQTECFGIIGTFLLGYHQHRLPGQ